MLPGLDLDTRSNRQEEMVSDSAAGLVLLSMRAQVAASAATRPHGIHIEQKEDLEAGPSASIPSGGPICLKPSLLCVAQLVYAAQLLCASSWTSTFALSIYLITLISQHAGCDFAVRKPFPWKECFGLMCLG